LFDTLAARITALIEMHRRSHPYGSPAEDVATRFGALVVYSDLGGVLMLCPDGSIMSLGWDDEEPSEPSDGWRILGLAAAAYRFPELAELAPERPATAAPCRACGGPGCQACFGMGWVPDVRT
jgi:hypothetical protein